MTPKTKEQRSPGELEDDTYTRRKKSRRVSFAETTVHIFTRDDESESPADSTPAPSEASGPSSDSEDDNLSSPLSAVGSVASNEDDNFFGPVSTSFINSAHLSESGMADDNSHDITLDSTAFSLHFRNIAPPDDRSANSAGDSMPLGFLVGKDQTDEELSSKCSVGEMSTVSGDWNEGNRIVRGSHSYDYGKLSLTLEALLDEVNLRILQKSPVRDSRFMTPSCQTEEVEGVKKPLQNSCFEDSDLNDGELQNSKLLSPSYGDLQNDLNGKVRYLQQERFGRTRNEGKRDSDERKLEPVCIDSTPKNATKSLLSQERQQFLSQSVPASNKSLPISAREKLAFRMDGSDDAAKAFHFSPLKESTNSLQFKQMQPPNFSLLSQGELIHDATIQQPASLRRELMEHISRSNAKSRMQSEHCPTPSSKDLFVTAFQSSPMDISYDRSKKHGDISAVNLDATEANVAKQLEALESMDISMVTPDNVVKSFQFPTISSYHDKGRHLQYPSAVSQSESLHSSAWELSASLKMELREHGERISSIKTSITRSRSKSRMDTDCESAPSMKDLFITNLQDSLNKANDDPYLKHAGISDVNVDANKLTAVMQLEDLDIVKDLDYLTGLDKNVALMDTVGKGQFEKTKEFCFDGSLKVPHTIDLCGSSINQRKAGLIESNKGISIKYSSANKEKSALSSDGCVTLGVDEITSSSEMVEPKSSQPATSFESPIEKGLAEKIVQSPNNHSFNEIDRVSLKNSQASLISFHGLRHQNTESQQEAHCGYDVTVIGDIRNNQTCHIENDGYSKSYKMQNSPVTLSEVLVDSAIMSVDSIHHDKALDMAGKARLKHLIDIDDLENLLDELQTARKYEGLCTALKNKNCCSDLQQKRVIEARCLLEMLGIAKARKQLKCLKLIFLHSKAQILQSQLDECGKLKSIYTHLRDRVTESDESSFCKYRLDEMKPEEQNRLNAMKQELGILEHNIKVLFGSFEASCKLTGKESSDDVIKAVEEHVMRRALCKQIQQHVQLGKVCDVVVENDHYDIILGYCNLLFQRFTIKKSRFSNIVASILPNAANITKKYPNMNAFMAFEFVFKFNVDQKLANSSCIYERTGETNLLMGTLIDVLEEILLSRVELLNLTFSTFLKQPTGELELQLCFYSFSGGRKLTLGVDMSILNCGIYPSDPSELKIRVCEQQTSLPSSIVNLVIGSVRSVECGHLMILRLCRRVSQVIQCSS